MNRILILPMLLATAPVWADTPLRSLVYYSTEAKRNQPGFVADSERGRSFVMRDWGVSQTLSSCAACHGDQPNNSGRHALTGDPIPALSPTLTPQRFSNPTRVSASAIIFATAMMYVRIIILLLIFNMKLAVVLLPYVMIVMFLSVAVGIAMFYLKRPPAEPAISDSSTKNPLELKMAFLFTFLFVLLSVITYFTIDFYGARGLNILSYVVGFTDIDPYLLNLFRSETHIDLLMIAKASLQAVFSNNILKALCTVFLADAWTRKYVLPGMGVITLVNLVMIFFV